MTDETTKITARANETMARSGREQLNVTQKVTSGEMTKAEALKVLDELEKADTELIADIDRRIEALEKAIEDPEIRPAMAGVVNYIIGKTERLLRKAIELGRKKA